MMEDEPLVFSPKQIETIRNESVHRITVELNEGTPRSGKTTADIFKMAAFYIASPDRNHLVSAYNQELAFRVFMDGDGKGLMHIFKDKATLRHDDHGDHLLLYAPNGEKKIYFKGGGKANSVGAITGMSLGSVVYIEFNLMNKEFIEESFRRTLMARMRYHLAEQNPPAPNHPNLEIFERFEKSGQFLFRHWTPLDNPKLTKKRQDEWYNQLKGSKYLLDRDWFGKRVMPKGVIYSMFDESKHKVRRLKGNVVETFMTGDAGQGDATSVCFWAVTFYQGKHYLYRMANFYHSGSDSGIIRSMSKYAKDIAHFIEWCYVQWPDFPALEYIFIDPAALSLRQELEEIGIMTEKADNNSKDLVHRNGTKIEIGIERTQSLLTEKRLFIFEHKEEHFDHYHFIKELGMYVRNDGGYPVDKDNHSLDECRYGVNYFVKTFVI